MVQIGNEVITGMLWPDGKLPEQWDSFADLLKAGIRGVEAGRGDGPRPRIMIHIDRGADRHGTQVVLRPAAIRTRRRLRRDRPVVLPLVARQPAGPAREPRPSCPTNTRRTSSSWKWPIAGGPPNIASGPARFPKLPKARRAFLDEVNRLVLATPGAVGASASSGGNRPSRGRYGAVGSLTTTATRCRSFKVFDRLTRK